MAAVAEVARDPASFSKYAENPKIRQFYAAFGGLLGARLDAGAGVSAASKAAEKRQLVQPVASAKSSSNFLP